MLPRLCDTGGMMEEMPEDPVSKHTEAAIAWHQMLMDYEKAGFTHDEAFELIQTHHSLFYTGLYMGQRPQ
jgi:hypothetical protein